ncbi:lysosomal proton-coupled steroid conjugate and bile acid symporter SLC46A3-like [Littorina saxatilis]|uniref:lysosomal proton-coupled steroid conjugate and bile acid symporter SLC46A3-like n=1 Tax=Littorina saxatilis TaxID=31220 RepID=UPI0038B478D9
MDTSNTTNTTNTTNTSNVSINTERTDIDGDSIHNISTNANGSCNATNRDSVSSKENSTIDTIDTDTNKNANISRPNDNTNITTKGNRGKDGPTNTSRQNDNTNRTTKGNSESKAHNDDSDDDDELDVSREKTRALKLALLDIVPGLMGSASSFGIGYIIRYLGFFYTLVIAISLKAVLLVFAFCFITETGEQRKSPGFIAPLRIFVKAARDPQKRITLLLVYLAVMFSAIAINDEFVVLPTYQMSPPFCFSSIQLGWYGGAVSFKGVLSLPMLWLFRRLRLSESVIAGLGVASNGAGALLLSIVRESWVFFAVPFISIPGALTKAMAKTLTSRLIGRSALASTFALIAIIQEVFWFLGTNASTYLYQSYVDTVPTAPFFLASAAFWVSAFLYCAQTCYQRRQPLPTGEVLTTVS